ncbi:restriction endonuclease subunit S [Leuconostoc pseudomesenteroides]|uniref:restriction endonuclease subunit S n=1 Tax=Leuconostoc falkenbergense TaxID=2766470 RepID=UPI000E090E60|nr:restriction endonuclease subunit S [Leuconostoc falkenbergense]RDG17424.1 restriction endonuclease subunit S [Leuconostoc pseudomesenteroides]
MAKIDDSVKKKVPELRFKGFTDDWEQRKLSNESTITAGGDIDKSKLKEVGEYPIFANALTNDGTVGYYDSYYRVEAPAVTVTGRGDVGHAKARKVNFTPVVRLLAVKSNHDVDFLENAINNHKVLVESTGVPQLTAPQLGNYKIFFPTGEEQQKIGSFFKQLDDTIALHQRKLDLLKEQKKGFLQKMFPKNGAKVPELRFAGFADDWEERKLLDNVEKVLDYRGKSPAKFGMEWGTEGYLVLSALNVKNGYIDKSVEAKYGDHELFDRWMGNNRLEKGDVVFTTEAPLGNVAQVPDNNGYILNQRAVAFKSLQETDDNFFAQLLRSPIVQNTLKASSSGGTAKGIGMKEFAKLNARVPETHEEQRKIGLFFKHLDDTIALHQRKLDLLKEQKKGFLQKMFV